MQQNQDLNIYPVLYWKGETFTEEDRMGRRRSLQCGEYISQSSTRRAEAGADIYIHVKRFFLNKELPYAIMGTG